MYSIIDAVDACGHALRRRWLEAEAEALRVEVMTNTKTALHACCSHRSTVYRVVFLLLPEPLPSASYCTLYCCVQAPTNNPPYPRAAPRLPLVPTAPGRF